VNKWICLLKQSFDKNTTKNCTCVPIKTPNTAGWLPETIYPAREVIYTSQPVVYTAQEAIYHPQPTVYKPQPVVYDPRSTVYYPQPVIYEAQPVVYTPREAIYTPQPVIYRSDEQVDFMRVFPYFALKCIKSNRPALTGQIKPFGQRKASSWKAR